jgi:hypothetical protein
LGRRSAFLLPLFPPLFVGQLNLQATLRSAWVVDWNDLATDEALESCIIYSLMNWFLITIGPFLEEK